MTRYQWVTIPYSEAAMNSQIAGMRLRAREEDTYINGKPIPEEKRIGCFVHDARIDKWIPLLKSEAGWED
jgi:hypothetical protein